MSLLPNPTKKNLVLYFQVHQPLRLRKYRFFDIGSGKPYIDEDLNREITERIARECYLPANMLLLRLIKQYPDIKVAFSISGVALDQFREYTPEVIDSFGALAETGSVEFLAETHYHSLACMIPGEEFEEQVTEHAQQLYEYFGIFPSVFRNTELIYNDNLGKRISNLGFQGVFCDGIEKVLGDRSPHHLYIHPENELMIFPRNYRLSDDIAFRYKQGSGFLTAEQYMTWLNGIPVSESLVTLAMDYETFGEHQKKATGILNFLEDLLIQLATHDVYRMVTPAEAVHLEKPKDKLSVPAYISWADRERDLSAWLGNVIQQDAFDTLLALEKQVKKTNDEAILSCWRMLQTSDHFYYMSTKKDDDGNVHSYFSPYPSPYEAFINYMNVLADFTALVNRKVASLESSKPVAELLEVS